MSTGLARASLRVLDEAHFGSCDIAHSLPAPEALLAGCAVVVCTRDRPDLLAGFLDSLAVQEPQPEQLVIVDASADARSAGILARHPARDALAHCIRYCRVDPAAASLTRQRSLALTMVATERLAAFDDDIVLLPGCLAAMNLALDEHSDIVGAAASMENAPTTVPWRWWLRRALLVVPSLEPGRYFASGVSTPWRYAPASDELDQGDWLPGGAVIWRTGIVRRIGYPVHFDGYGSGEDLAFSLCIRRFGRLVTARRARLLHLQQGGGRPDPRRLAFEMLRNRVQIRRLALEDGQGNLPWFIYAMAMETLIEALDLVRPGRSRRAVEYLRGVVDCIRSGAAVTGPARGGEVA